MKWGGGEEGVKRREKRGKGVGRGGKNKGIKRISNIKDIKETANR